MYQIKEKQDIPNIKSQPLESQTNWSNSQRMAEEVISEVLNPSLNPNTVPY